MNTLQKISELEAKISVLTKMTVEFPKLVQDFTRLADDMRQMNEAIRKTHEVILTRTAQLSGTDNTIITRMMGQEASLASLSKTMAAIVAELVDNKSVDNDSVMTRIRRLDEGNDQIRIEKMVEQKVLEEAEFIGLESTLVVAQTFTFSKDANGFSAGDVDVVSEYRSVDLTSPDIPEDDKKSYIGKCKNDTVELNLDDGVLKTTILKIYNYVKVYASKQGEDPSQDGAESDGQTEKDQDAQGQEVKSV
jgi:hypothetical protein